MKDFAQGAALKAIYKLKTTLNVKIISISAGE